MPTFVLKTEEEIEDFVRGCAFMATGGGGSPKMGAEFLIEDLRAGREIKLADVSEVPDDAWTCCALYVGSIAPPTPEAMKTREKYGLKKKIAERPLTNAVKELEKYKGIKIDAIVPYELGGRNTPAPIDAAVRLGLVAVDGDYNGRATPEMALMAIPVNLYDKEQCPVVFADVWGNVIIIKNTVSKEVLENLKNMVSGSAFGLVGAAYLALKGKDMKKTIIPDTLTECLRIGKAIKEARKKGKDPVEELVKSIDGWLLFKGKVEKKDWEDREAHMWGTTTISGTGEFGGQTFKIWFKNENQISWKNGKVFVTSPDIIEVVELETAEPTTNTDLAEGNMVAVIGKASDKRWRTKKGIEAWEPKHFGFDFEYVPIEERMKQLQFS